MRLVNITFIFYFLYSAIVKVVLLNIPYINIFIVSLLLFFVILSFRKKNMYNIKRLFPFEVMVWLIFIVYCILTGFFIAKDLSKVISYSVNFFEYISIIVVMLYISFNSKDGGIRFFSTIFIFYGVFLSLSLISFPSIEINDRYSVSEWSNENEIALIMMLGSFFTIMGFKQRAWLNIVWRTLIVFLLAYGILLTGSRKSLIGVALVITLEVGYLLLSPLLTRKSKRILPSLILLIFIIFSFLTFYNYMYLGSILETRINELLIYGDEIRFSMYNEAYILFNLHPLFGVGLGNFEVVSSFGTFSHSTYAELISTTGLFGSICFALTYFSIGTKLLSKLISSKSLVFINLSVQMTILFLLIMYLGLSVIQYDSIVAMFSFGCILAYINMNTKFSNSVMEKKRYD